MRFTLVNDQALLNLCYPNASTEDPLLPNSTRYSFETRGRAKYDMTAYQQPRLALFGHSEALNAAQDSRLDSISNSRCFMQTLDVCFWIH